MELRNRGKLPALRCLETKSPLCMNELILWLKSHARLKVEFGVKVGERNHFLNRQISQHSIRSQQPTLSMYENSNH